MKLKVISALFVFLIVFSQQKAFTDYTISVSYEHCETVMHCETWWDPGPPFITGEICTPEEQCYSESVSYTIDGGINPDALAALCEELESDPNVDFSIEDPSVVDVVTTAYNESAELPLSLQEIKLSVDAFIAQAEEEIENRDYSAFSPTGGDPVRLATGEFTSEETDLSFPAPGGMLAITREYLAAGFGSGSLGSVWTFPYDTRIIRGIKPLAQTQLDNLNAAYTTLSQNYSAMDNAYTITMGKMDLALQKADGTIAEINATITALQNAQGGAPSEVQGAISQDLTNAQAVLVSVQGIRDTIAANRSEVIGCRWKIDKIKAWRDEVYAQLQITIKENEASSSIESGNRYVVDADTPAHLRPLGLDRLALVDESGTPHLYFIDSVPEWDSAGLLADGRKNYHPQGSTTTANLSSETDVLTILSNGSYQLVKKDRRVFLFDIYGRLQTITDPNGNVISLEYGDDGKSNGIRDSASRLTVLERTSGLITRIEDPLGRSVQYGYDGSRRLTSVTDTTGDTVGYEYSGNLLTAIVKPDGSRREYGYDSSGRAVSSTDEEGAVEQFRYFSGYTEHLNASGILERHFFNEKNLETEIQYADGSSRRMYYDDDNNLVQLVDEAGGVWTYTYDERRNRLSATDPNGATQRWTYTAGDLVSSYTDAENDTTTYTYDAAGNLVEVTDPEGGTTRHAYDSRGLRLSTKDANKNTTRYEYDQYGSLIAVIDPLGGRTEMERDIVGRTLAATDPDGNTTRYAYTKDDRLTEILYADGSSEKYVYNNRKDMISSTDELGNLTSFNYDKRHLLTKVTDPLSRTLTYEYRGDGKVVKETIDGKSTTTYAYDERGNLASSTQVETGIVRRYAYDELGRVEEAIDPRNNVTRFAYDAWGRITLVKDPLGAEQSFLYDDNGNLIKAVDKRGSQTLYEYDFNNRAVRSTNAYGNSKTMAYDDTGNLTELRDEAGAVTHYAYDANNRASSITDALGYTVSYTYTPGGLVQTKTDEAGHTASYSYDNRRRLTVIRDPMGGTQSFSYDAAGNLLSLTDANGNAVSQSYDALGRVIELTDGEGNKTRFEYDYLGKLSARTDALNNVTRSLYDAAGRLIVSTDPLGKSKRYVYDPGSNLIEAIDELERKTLYAYDALDALASETDPLGNATGYTRDSMGSVTKVTYANGSTFGYEYDLLGRKVSETDQLGKTQSFVYDTVGNRIEQTDFNGHTTRYEYDALRRLTRVSYFDGTSKSFSYDPVGNIIGAQNGNGTLEYGYDENNRLILSKDSATGQSLRYSYDPAGNRTGLYWEEKDRTLSYAYDKNNRLLVLTDPDGKKTVFGYDELGREESRELPNGVFTTRSYDAAGRLIALKNTSDKYHGYGEDRLLSEAYLYNKAGERTFTVTNTGEITAYEYDAGGQLVEVDYPLSTAKTMEDLKERISLGLVEDGKPSSKAGDLDRALGRLPEKQSDSFDLKEVKDQLGQLSGNGRGWGFGIGAGANKFGQMLSVDGAAAEALSQAYEMIDDSHGSRGGRLNLKQWMWEEEFVYDELGNRVSLKNGWGEVEYQYDPANRMLEAGKRGYGYDANGNLIDESLGEKEAVYAYTAENRLEHAVSNLVDSYSGGNGKGFSDFGGKPGIWSGTREVSYTYDALGRRNSRAAGYSEEETRRSPRQIVAEKCLLGGGNGFGWDAEQTQKYLYDGLGFNVMAEIRSTESGHGDNRFGWKVGQNIVEYIHANGALTQRRELSGWRNWNDVNYFTQDILGSTMQVTNAWGAVKESYAYDAFGTAYRGDLSGENAVGYNGKRYDPVLSLYNYGFRDYSSMVARWTTPDPIRVGKNWFGYVQNNPLRYIDRFGLSPSDNIASSLNEDLRREMDARLDDPYNRSGYPGYNPAMPNNACDNFVENSVAAVPAMSLPPYLGPADSTRWSTQINNMEDTYQGIDWNVVVMLDNESGEGHTGVIGRESNGIYVYYESGGNAWDVNVDTYPTLEAFESSSKFDKFGYASLNEEER